jgi:hypothetical protein
MSLEKLKHSIAEQLYREKELLIIKAHGTCCTNFVCLLQYALQTLNVHIFITNNAAILGINSNTVF